MYLQKQQVTSSIQMQTLQVKKRLAMGITIHLILEV